MSITSIFVLGLQSAPWSIRPVHSFVRTSEGFYLTYYADKPAAVSTLCFVYLNVNMKTRLKIFADPSRNVESSDTPTSLNKVCVASLT